MIVLIKLISSSILGSLIAYFGLIVFPSSKDGDSGYLPLSKRVSNWNRVIKMDKRLLLFDVFFSCIIISVAYTIILLDVVSCRQALLGGLTAEAFFYHYIHNARNRSTNNN